MEDSKNITESFYSNIQNVTDFYERTINIWKFADRREDHIGEYWL